MRRAPATPAAHYTGALMVPILNLMQQMQMRGVVDAFATEKRLRDYAQWEMQLLTPPEVRFGGLRKIISVGDGCTEQDVRIGQLGTGFARSDPPLSARLMGAWKAMGSPQDNFYGASLLKIDPALPAVSPQLGSAQFNGWMSVLRHGWETKDETSIHFINGDDLTDHRHNDQGEVIIYALVAPLSLDFGCMYYPRAAGGYLHSTGAAGIAAGFCLGCRPRAAGQTGRRALALAGAEQLHAAAGFHREHQRQHDFRPRQQ